MANYVKLTVVGSSFQPGGPSAVQFTAKSPSFYRYFPIPNGVTNWFGDYVAPTSNNFIVQPAGYIRVGFHVQNQWVTGDFYTVENGAAIAVLFG